MMLDIAIKITALFGAAWAASFLLRGRAASIRHAVWCGLMAAALLLPIFGALAPSIELAWLPAEPPGMQQPPSGAARHVETPTGVERPAPAAADEMRASAPPRQASTLRSIPTLTQTLGALWLFVALMFVVRIAVAHVRARRMLDACVDPPEALVSALTAVARELNARVPPLRLAAAGTMPAVIGVVRPSVILPADAMSWTADRLRVVLLHECAHVRRRDALLQVIASLATAAYWWHPLTWLAARRVVLERELACDDLVVAAGTSGPDYASHLIDIARALKPSRQPAMAALAMARPSELEGRLIALLEARPRRSRPARSLALGLALALVALLGIAPLKIVAQDGAPVAAPVSSPEPISSPAPVARQDAAPAQTPPEPRSLTATDAVQAVPAPALDQAMADALWGATKDSRPDIRLLAYATLSRSSSPKRVPALLAGLADPSEDVRTMALLGLIQMEQPEVVPHLSRAIEDESSDVRRAAVVGLSRMEHPDKAALLLKAASDPSEDVRTMAALGLGRVSGAAVDEMLVKLASDASADVRRAAIIAIALRTGRDPDGVGFGIGDDLGAGLAQGIAQGVAQGVAQGAAGGLAPRDKQP